MDFKIGDNVQHNSGGPIMTVEYVNPHGENGKVKCKWWIEETKSFKEGTFDVGTIKLAPKADSGAMPIYTTGSLSKK